MSFSVVAVSSSGPDRVVAVFGSLAEADAAALLANRVDPSVDYRVDDSEPLAGIYEELCDLGCF